MLVNNIDITVFKAMLCSKDIQTADVITYDDWLRKALNPLYMGKTEQYKQIKLEILIAADDDENALTNISNLIKQFEKCIIKFDDLSFYYDCIISNKSHEKVVIGTYELNVELKGYAYKDTVTENMSNVHSKTINVDGNLPTPAIVTLTPSQDIGSVSLTGFTKKSIVISDLHAGVPITIDGENCLVTEADIESILTESQSANKWVFRKYSTPNIFSSDIFNADFIPTKLTIPANTSYKQKLIDDGTDLYNNGGYDYLGYLKTAVYTSSSKSFNIEFYHDDGCSLYVNNSIVYSMNHAQNIPTARANATIALNPGWNTIEIIWIQHYGMDGIWGISPVLNTQVDALNCYYATKDNLTGLVNKFPDTDMWEFPNLQPGANIINIDSNVCNVEIKYKPKYM